MITTYPLDQLAVAQALPNPKVIKIGFGEITVLTELYVPAREVPQSITMRQGLRALHLLGLLVMVESTLAGMAGDAGEMARIDWRASNDMQRNWPLVTDMAATLGLSSSQLDDIFIWAATL